MSWIKTITETLHIKHKTRNPFELASHLNINVVLWDLHEEINGFYKYERRNKFIYINSNLNYEKQYLVCAHELGHAVLHPRANTPFMKRNTLLSVSRIEVEANTFAAELIIPDDLIKECDQLTVYEIASLHNVPVEIALLKCKGLF
ncbi:ImmA/IrrE family metallo-endopeptidase [Viridibacillus arvi]|uniref:ImmA/IrrE family metallo-endopeptidase n=1 Tax=Viridibacillus arvi TaxID=263475 RepID=UPI003D03DD84